jgi:hypothetical protein
MTLNGRSIRGAAFVRSKCRQKEAPDERGFMSKGGTLGALAQLEL